MLSTIKNKLISLIQLILVVMYILFEELIWEGIAKPIYEAIHALKLLQTIETKLQDVNARVILALFVVLLVVVEALGIYAGMLFVSGQMVLGVLLYVAKIPVAAFTFWLFRVTEEKLMRFGWFKWLYEKVMAAIEWLKRQDIYQKTMQQIQHLKAHLKAWVSRLKSAYFSQESPFVASVKRLYVQVKRALKKQ